MESSVALSRTALTGRAAKRGSAAGTPGDAIFAPLWRGRNWNLHSGRRRGETGRQLKVYGSGVDAELRWERV